MSKAYKYFWGVLSVFYIFASSVSASKGTLKIRADSSNITEQDSNTVAGCSSSNGFDESTYNFGFHLGALFIILATSSFGAFLPVLSKKYPKFKFPQAVFFFTKNFGSGVILATAFIHMLPSAFDSLTNPCLPSVWSNYNAWPGAIAMMSALFIFFLEYFAVKLQSKKDMLPTDAMQNIVISSEFKSEAVNHHCHHGSFLFLTNEAQILGIVILEVGICFHSVIIGIALSVEDGSTFVSLLIALIFHQLFEGLGLGSRIAELEYNKGSYKPWLMSLTYGITTPLGIAIGLGVRRTYHKGSETALITQGVLDSVSAGILLYVALVELVANDFIYDEAFRKKSNLVQISAFICLVMGAGVMALI
ncbi:196_t:CDS:2, partial [Acaulospora morrowiae]